MCSGAGLGIASSPFSARGAIRDGVYVQPSAHRAQMYRFLAPILAASWVGMRSFAPCCTKRSHPPLYVPQADAAERGREVLVAGLPCYETRPSSEISDTNGPAVLVFTDVFGWRSGRTRLLCDQLAEEAGLQVPGRASALIRPRNPNKKTQQWRAFAGAPPQLLSQRRLGSHEASRGLVGSMVRRQAHLVLRLVGEPTSTDRPLAVVDVSSFPDSDYLCGAGSA